MTCPVCKRELAPTLSICFTCGTMVRDTVREELETKIERVSQPLPRRIESIETEIPAVMAAPNPAPVVTSRPQAPRSQAVNEMQKPVSPFKVDTTQLGNKKTSPILVEFQAKNPSVPDWRLQLQNAVRQRRSDGTVIAEGPAAAAVAPAPAIAKKQQAPQPAPEVLARMAANSKIENALKRIEDSREKFGTATGEAAGQREAPARPAKNFPFDVVERSADPAPPQKATVNPHPKPRLVSELRKTGYDTNKLPKIAVSPTEPAIIPRTDIEERQAKTEEPAEEIVTVVPDRSPTVSNDIAIGVHDGPADVLTEIAEEAEDDDLAPLSSRLTAGFFDIIIGVFVSAIVLSPMMLSGGNWMSFAGVLACAAIFGLVMFTYLTLSIGFYGRTLGMRIFSLELIDAEANDYPTLHQAAVNSAVFVLSLPFLGLGFLPALFNEERQAAHDLFSGTVLVREA